MKKSISGLFGGRFFSPDPRHSQSSLVFLLLIFSLGVLAGGIVGFFSPIPELPGDISTYVQSSLLPRSFLSALGDVFRFFLLALVFSTSYLGVFLIPSLVLVKAYMLSCSVAVLFAAYSYKGLSFSALISGVPALFLIPCFLIACSDCFFASRQLFLQRFHGLPYVSCPNGVRHFLFILPILVLAALYGYWLLPQLLIRIT